MQNPDQALAIITVNYRTPELVLACIESILADSPQMPPFKIFVIDNASGDDSVTLISSFIRQHNLDDQVELMASPVNGGYAAGNNLALERILADLRYSLIWLLNPDTRIYPGAANTLIEFLKANPDAAATGSRLEDADGSVQTSAFRFPSAMSELLGSAKLGILDKLFSTSLVPMPQQDEPFEADWLAGASMMLRREVVDQIGLMDEHYFLYFEEVDYCYQIRQQGHQIWYVPNSRVYHAVGAATGISELRNQAPRRPQYWFDSRRRYFLKNNGRLHTLLADIAHLTGFASWKIRSRLQRKPDLDPPGFWRDLFRNSVFKRGFALESGSTTSTPGLWEQIRSDWIAHEKDWTKPGFRALAIYRFGVWRMQIRSKLVRAPLSLLYRFLFRRARNLYGIELPYSALVGQQVVFEHQGGIVIHGNAVVGDGCIIRQGVTLGNRHREQPLDAPELGNRVNVGAGAKILGKLTIGDDASIGANAVVLQDVPAGALAVGIPATIKAAD